MTRIPPRGGSSTAPPRGPDPRDTEISRLRSLLEAIEERAGFLKDFKGSNTVPAMLDALNEIRDLAALREKPE